MRPCTRQKPREETEYVCLPKKFRRYWRNKDATRPEYYHVYEQVGYLLSGKMKLSIEGTPRVLLPGDIWNIASNLKHKTEITE